MTNSNTNIEFTQSNKPCDNVVINITTTGTVVIDRLFFSGGNIHPTAAAQQLSFDLKRNQDFMVTFGDQNGNFFHKKGTTPPLLEIQTKTYLSDNKGTLEITSSPEDLELQFRIAKTDQQPGEWTSKRSFENLKVNQTYILYYKDQYGCTKQKKVFIDGNSINISGFNANAYYINNPIIIQLSTKILFFNVDYYQIKITNIRNNNTQIFRLKPKTDNTLKVDISQILKAMFKKPNHNTSLITIQNYENSAREVFNFVFTAYGKQAHIPINHSSVFNGKVFLRGGVRENKTNVIVSNNAILRSSATLPVWPGYPTEDYKTTKDFNIERIPVNDVLKKEYLKVKTCNPVYLKFLNSKGGYSYWLFESQTDSLSNKNLGFSNNFENPNDFGNQIDTDLVLYSKVPKKFYGIIFDLIESPEIYIYNKNVFLLTDPYQRIISNDNKLESNNFKKVYEVKLSFKKLINYNPQILWQ